MEGWINFFVIAIISFLGIFTFVFLLRLIAISVSVVFGSKQTIIELEGTKVKRVLGYVVVFLAPTFMFSYFYYNGLLVISSYLDEFIFLIKGVDSFIGMFAVGLGVNLAFWVLSFSSKIKKILVLLHKSKKEKNFLGF